MIHITSQVQIPYILRSFIVKAESLGTEKKTLPHESSYSGNGFSTHWHPSSTVTLAVSIHEVRNVFRFMAMFWGFRALNYGSVIMSADRLTAPSFLR